MSKDWEQAREREARAKGREIAVKSERLAYLVLAPVGFSLMFLEGFWQRVVLWSLVSTPNVSLVDQPSSKVDS